MDYAKKENASRWLRHPVLGDPSFDGFQKLCTVHRSEPPYELTVNDSLFRDPADGAWYCFAGRYPLGYISEKFPARYCIYRSRDEGKTWEALGGGEYDPDFRYEGFTAPVFTEPDVVVFYDEMRKKYLMASDMSMEGGTAAESGSAVAWAESPAGPYRREKKPVWLNNRADVRLGRFSRGYATTVIPREKDYLALVLLDSGEHFAWGLAGMTSPDPAGGWSDPVLLLSCDRPGYYPAPVEFYPAMVRDGTVYAPATSVAKNRNYQALFTAPLERAHDPSAWSLAADGGLWHSRPLPEEAQGIWGQTLNGFLHDGKYTVVYPALDDRKYGTINIAQCRADELFTDGFTFSGNGGRSVSPMLAAYRQFSLEAEFKAYGTVEFAFDYDGILGPDRNISDSVPAETAFSDYRALRVNGRGWRLVRRERGAETLLAAGEAAEEIRSFRLVRGEDTVSLWVNGEAAAQAAGEPARQARPLALVAWEHSILECSRFCVTGAAERYALRYNAWDALLGAGERLADWKRFASADGDAFAGGAYRTAKWNVVGDEIGIDFPRPEGGLTGVVGVWVDGAKYGTADLSRSGSFHAKIRSGFGRHGIVLKPESGEFSVGTLTVSGSPDGGSRL